MRWVEGNGEEGPGSRHGPITSQSGGFEWVSDLSGPRSPPARVAVETKCDLVCDMCFGTRSASERQRRFPAPKDRVSCQPSKPATSCQGRSHWIFRADAGVRNLIRRELGRN